jgi:hypothetical protein
MPEKEDNSPTMTDKNIKHTATEIMFLKIKVIESKRLTI